MSRRRYAKTPDANEAAIVDALREAGCNVSRIEGRSGSAGVPDLLVEYDDPLAQAARAAITDVWNDLLRRGDTTYNNGIGLATAALAKRQWLTMEVKNPETTKVAKNIRARDLVDGGKYAPVLEYCDRRTAMICKESQGDFFLAHTAPMAVVTSVEEALAAVGIEVES